MAQALFRQDSLKTALIFDATQRAGGTDGKAGAAGVVVAGGKGNPAPGFAGGSVGDCREGSVGGAPGLAGALVPGTAGLRIDVGRRAPSVNMVRARLVTKKTIPRIAVVRVSVLAAPRCENSPPRPEPLPPMPSAPPSERCNSTTKISATATNR